MSTTVVLSPSTMNSRSPDTSNKRQTETIVYNNCSNGLGIKIIGGLTDDGDKEVGIFVKKVLAGGLAADGGRLQDGDQILEVNGQRLEHVSNDRAVTVLRSASASNRVIMVVTRDEQSQLEFVELMELSGGYSYSTTSGSVTDSVISSRASTPLANIDLDERSWLGQKERVPALQGSETESNSAKSSSELDIVLNNRTPQSRSNNASPMMGPLSFNQNSMSPGTGHLLANRNSASPLVNHLPPNRGNMSTMAGHVPVNQAAVMTSSQTRAMSQSRKLSLDPHVRLRVEKLEVALKYLGIEPSSEQQYELRRRLKADPNGYVSYGDFVRTSRDIFRFELEERNISNSSMLFAANDITDFTEPPPFKPELSSIQDVTVTSSKNAMTGMTSSKSVASQDYNALKQENAKLKQEIEKMKISLKEKEKSCSFAEQELLKLRREAQGAIHESRSLRSKVHLAEQAQHAARGMEQDYEEVIGLLEREISELKADQAKQLENPVVQKRLAVLGCQLRKAEVSKKTYEVATEKLLQFAEVVHECTAGQGDNFYLRSDSTHGDAGRGNRPPGYLAKHKKLSASSLSAEARDVVKSVKCLIEAEPLPFGWDEAYTSDGMKYYTNHVTQQTAWTHPVSQVQHLPNTQRGDTHEVLT